ncbi:MAG: NAD(P)-binding protein, partial [Oscillospiraceae bacterium]|nr:NAD(P)-binding protein [Oscillospiraceae bacterium]
MKHYDRIIIGAGIYGLYAAIESGKLGKRVLVLEADEAPFQRATFVNQARVH